MEVTCRLRAALLDVSRVRAIQLCTVLYCTMYFSTVLYRGVLLSYGCVVNCMESKVQCHQYLYNQYSTRNAPSTRLQHDSQYSASCTFKIRIDSQINDK